MNNLEKVANDLDERIANTKAPSELLWNCVQERLNNNALNYYKKLLLAQERVLDFIEQDDILKTAEIIVRGFNRNGNE